MFDDYQGNTGNGGGAPVGGDADQPATPVTDPNAPVQDDSTGTVGDQGGDTSGGNVGGGDTSGGVGGGDTSGGNVGGGDTTGTV